MMFMLTNLLDTLSVVSFLIILSASSCAAAPTSESTTCRPTVTLASGVLVGTTTSWPSASVTVNKFLSVPFASPPQRFSPPEDPASWVGERDASQLPPACLQQFSSNSLIRAYTIGVFASPPPASESEDCLYLNIFTPASPKKGKAVMFWIYGGALEFGYSGQSTFDGSSFAANQDVIVVTTNYRTNVFGFSNSPEIPFGKQNSGFLDQRKALQWVRDNIHAFGGDKHRITIFGESAGGYSVKQLLAHPPVPIGYYAAIMESEATYTGNSTAAWNSLVSHLNCTTATSPIACVRTLNATTVLNTITSLDLSFMPVDDGITNSNNIAPFINSGTFAQVPILIGTNSQEGRAFEVGQYNATTFVQKLFPGLTQIQQDILAAYANKNMSGYDIASAIFTDIGFQCPVMTLANLAASRGSNYTNIWRYYFNASFPNAQPFPNLGVYHESEIPIVFGTYNTVDATTQQVTLSQYMQGAWARFAKRPSGGPGWRRVGSNSSMGVLGNVGGAMTSKVSVVHSESVDQPYCDILAPIVAYLGI